MIGLDQYYIIEITLKIYTPWNFYELAATYIKLHMEIIFIDIIKFE